MSTGRSTTVRDRDRRAIARTRPPCHICEQPIDYTLPHLDPMAYVVDHIIPLARGGLDALENKAAAHRSCNRTKSDKVTRRVALICGAPGAGKTTLARSLGLTVYDVDDPQWMGSESLFGSALTLVAQDDSAQAAVIRSAATLSAREKAAAACGATEVRVLETDLDTCIARITERGRTNQPLKAQIAAAQDWWRKYEPGDVMLTRAATGPRVFVTSRMW